METFKKEFLELLDKDLEFRYAVAGFLGLSEILKRLDALAEGQVKIWEEIAAIKEEQKSLREEQIKLREEQIKLGKEQKSLREEQIKLREEQIKLWEEQKSLREEQIRLVEEQKNLREEQIKLREEQIKLREDFNRMLEEFRVFNVRLGRVERTLEKWTVDVEDEARSVVESRLRDSGIDVRLSSLSLPEVEVNLYGVSGEYCVLGEATVRAGAAIVDELLGKLERLRKIYPERLRRRVIPVVYACLPMEELKEKAREKNVWLLKATEEFFRPERLYIEL